VPLVAGIVRFYRELIDTYVAKPAEQPFDLAPWRMRLEAIQAERDSKRSNMTLVLLNEARQPVPHRTQSGFSVAVLCSCGDGRLARPSRAQLGSWLWSQQLCIRYSRSAD